MQLPRSAIQADDMRLDSDKVISKSRSVDGLGDVGALPRQVPAPPSGANRGTSEWRDHCITDVKRSCVKPAAGRAFAPISSRLMSCRIERIKKVTNNEPVAG